MELEKLKAIAYDCLVQLELWKQRLEVANKNIREYQPPAPKPNPQIKDNKDKKI